MTTEASAVLNFWFGRPDEPGYGQPQAAWFKKDEAFDRQIRQRFETLVVHALAGGIDDWLVRPLPAATAPGTPCAPVPPSAQGALNALARTIVLDQFPRNIWRGSARAFAGDAQALQTAQALVDSGADRVLTGVQRQFAYLPFEHAENLAHQNRAVQLFEQLARDEPALADLVTWARRHRDVVARFGRFPHRNASLGRISTAEEQAYLQEPGSGF